MQKLCFDPKLSVGTWCYLGTRESWRPLKSTAEKDFLSKLRNYYFFFINIDLFMLYKNVNQKLERADAFLCSLKITKVEDA